MNSDALILRLADSADARAIASMSRDYIESGLGWKYDAARVLRAIQDRETAVVVACDPSEVVGFAIMEFGETRAHLVLLAVRPRRRRLGTGRRLMQWLLESAQTAGIESIHLELRASNEAARAFYRVLGFAPTIMVPGYYGGREAALRMIRVLRQEGPLPFQWQPPMTNS
jgi:ribosomal-protein-alanine N-acetyltransferase